MAQKNSTVNANDSMTDGDVFENLRTGDKILWDGRKQPLTVTVGYFDGLEQIEDLENVDNPTLLVEGPRGGEKMLHQNHKDRDSIRYSTFSMSDSGANWISNLRIVENVESQ